MKGASNTFEQGAVGALSEVNARGVLYHLTLRALNYVVHSSNK
jgi:hypothetical protein